MTKPTDVFDAARQVAEILEPFENADRERVVRWAREQVGMSAQTPSDLRVPMPTSVPSSVAPTSGVTAPDIRAFIADKRPKNDIQLAAVVAYYNRFISPDRKDTFTTHDLITACRQAVRRQPARVAQTLVNAYGAGVFDKVDRGHYKLNSVGENLVAISLPQRDGGGDPPVVKTRKKTRARKKTSPRRLK